MSLSYLNSSNCDSITKTVGKAIMLRSKFKNRSVKEKSKESKGLYNKQRNVFLILLGKTKKKQLLCKTRQ